MVDKSGLTFCRVRASQWRAVAKQADGDQLAGLIRAGRPGCSDKRGHLALRRGNRPWLRRFGAARRAAGDTALIAA
jgi:hypothetical protein